jgi:hypothetical protein
VPASERIGAGNQDRAAAGQRPRWKSVSSMSYLGIDAMRALRRANDRLVTLGKKYARWGGIRHTMLHVLAKVVAS